MTEYEINMQQYLENIAVQNAEMMKQFDMIRKRQQQTDEQLEELIGDSRKPRERQEIVPLNDDSSEISLSCHELSLLPIFSTAAKGYVAKLDSLERKRAEQADKLDRHEAKLNDTKDRIERLKDINKMLETTAERMSIGVINNVLNSVREHNIKKLEKLEKETVPKLENKVAKDKRRINKVETNIDITQSKYDKCAAMSGIIRSFAILNTDKRRAVFVDSVNSLHSSQCRLNEAKINKANIRLDKLCQKYEDAQTYTEANDIKIKQNKLYDKIKKLNEEKKKLEKSEYKNPFTVEEKQAADENMRSTAALMMKRAEENPTDENIAEAAQTATTKENVKSFDITEAASMLIATIGYNSDMYSLNEDGAINDMLDNGFDKNDIKLAAAAIINYCAYEGSVSLENRQWADEVCRNNGLSADDMREFAESGEVVYGDKISSVVDKVNSNTKVEAKSRK